jgi:hypothetical protein
MSTATETGVPPAAPATPADPARACVLAAKTRREWLFHLGLLLLCLAVVTLAATMSVQQATQVTLPGMTIPVPELCYFRRGTSIECPGCGLTRSFISLAHGQFLLACRYNIAGVLFFPVVAFQIPYRVAQMLRLGRGLPAWDLTLITPSVFIGLFLVMLVQWVAKLLSLW